MDRLAYYVRTWLRLSLSSFQVALVSRLGALLFTVAKFLRFGFFVMIVVFIVTRTETLAGYTLTQSLIFFLTYNIIDTTAQLLFRDVYRFREKIVSGDFDLTLIKPISSLFIVLMGGADPLDLVVLLPYLVVLVYLLTLVPFALYSFLAYLLLIINSFLIASSFHIAVLALGILTTEIDHAIMIYRDVTSMARFPVDIYKEPLKGFITFVIPVGIMMTFPPKALFGLLTPTMLFISCVIGIVLFYGSLQFWQYSLRRYTSASS